MKTTLRAFYGSSNTPCITFAYTDSLYVTHYAVKGSLTINSTLDELVDGVDVEYITDVDCCTASEPIESASDIEELMERSEDY